MSELVEFARIAEQKLGERLNAAKTRNQSILARVEDFQPADKVVRGRAMQFSVQPPPVTATGIRVPGRLLVKAGSAGVDERLHPFALSQMLEKAAVPKPYSDTLLARADWSRELLAHNLNTIYAHSTDNHLLRSVNGEVRGFLSDRYRRLDSRPLIETFLRKCQEIGAVMCDGHFTDTKIMIKAILPRVYRLSTTEVVTLGVMFGNSDFGNGPLEISFFLERLVCRNGMIAERALRKIHLGARLEEGISWSERTQLADQNTMREMVGDLVRGQLGPGNIDTFVNNLKQANATEVSPEQIGKFLAKDLSKTEATQVIEQFRSADVVNLPAGQTKWRLANAISFVAGNLEDEERRVELQKLAGVAADPRTFS